MLRKYEEETVINAVGGRFKLASLLEKRYRELLFGGRPLVEVESNDVLDTLLEEVVQGKIELVPEAEAIAAAAASLMADLPSEPSEEVAARAALEAVAEEPPAAEAVHDEAGENTADAEDGEDEDEDEEK